MINNIFKESISFDEVNELPLGSFPGQVVIIDSLLAVHGMVNVLQQEKLLGFDTETKPSFKKGRQNSLAMLQISTADTCYLVRINKVGLHDEIMHLLANPSIVKVGLSLRDDMSAINKVRHFKPAGFIDLQQIVGEYGIEDKSLKKLSAILLGIKISKSQQTSNWENETLTEPQKLYAATDAWVCREMYLRLMNLGRYAKGYRLKKK
jgi:ribonuclease D